MQRPNILIVDDDKGQRLRLGTLFEQAGYHVQLANDGEQALASARTTPPDIVLSDVMMTGMDGYELAMAFKDDPKLRHVPLALHSSIFNNARDRLLAGAIGVDAFFDKDVPVDEMLATLKEVSQANEIAAANDSIDKTRFLRMRSKVLSEKVGAKISELESERHRADATAQQLQTIADALPDLIAEVGTDYRYSYVNQAYEEWHGRNSQEIIGLQVEELLGKEAFARIEPHLEKAMQGEAVAYEERFEYAASGSRYVWVRYLPHFNKQGKVSGIHVIVSDITERKATEAQLKKTNRCYLIMLQLNKLVSQAETEQELLDGACTIISQSSDFPLAWIGRVSHDAQQQVIPIAQAGFDQEYLDGLRISWGDNEYGRGPTGTAVRTALPQVIDDIHNNPNYLPWREQALRHGYASSVALPVTIDGGVIAALNIYATQPYAFSRADTELLEKLASDIGHGIQTLRLKQERRQIEESLRKANRAYRTLVSLKKSLARHHDEESLLKDVCQILVDSGSYRLAWIGYAQQDSKKTIQAVASAGDQAHYLEEMQFSWGENPLGRGPAGKAIRDNQTIIMNDIATTPDFQLWSEAAIERGYQSLITIPLNRNRPDKVFGTLTLYADVKQAFHPEEVELLEEFAEELAYGIIAIREQNIHQQTAGELAYQRKLFEAVFRHIPDTMVITDTEHRIILCNSALIRDFGYVPEELIGESPTLLYAEQTQFERQQQLRFHHQASDINTPYNVEYRRKDGSCFHGETLGAAFRDKEQNLLGYITIVRDITERQMMESEHAQLEMQLQQSQKMETVGQLTGGIAHDFNNILASILGYTELAQLLVNHTGEQGPAKMARYLNEIRSAGERARDIISQLLTFSRTGASEQQLMALGPLLEETTSLLKPSLSSSIELSLNMDDPLPQIEADASQLHQVIMNLCINARDAMQGRGEITINLSQLKRHSGLCSACGEKFHGDYLKLSVTDSGSGIPEEVLTRMFDPFFTTKAIGKGTGMGLSMVHGIIHDHRGHIQVSTSDSGTTFTIYLPTAEAHHPTALAEPRQTNDAPAHIAVIDDEPLLVEFLEQLLIFNGYQVSGFSDPEEALNALTQQNLPCDLVITDRIMPGIDGIELASRLKQQRPELPLLLCSSNIADFTKEEAENYGFSAFLPKPINSTQLLTLVQQQLSARGIASP